MKSIFENIIIAVSCIITFGYCTPKEQFVYNEGYIFGTTYHIKYKSDTNYHNDIIKLLNCFNKSLSTYDKESTISKINKNDTVVLDSLFITCFLKAQEISEITDGAFDLTVAPIVNAWGFGFDESEITDSALIDSLMTYVGFYKVALQNGKINKEYPETMLDASAIAKGFGVDIASNFLIDKGICDFMVEIGGEVRVNGKNQDKSLWRVGIDKPIEDRTAKDRKLQSIIKLDNKSMATSGNYRQFYEKNGIKYSHTINPKTGYPALNTLLSSSVIANDCMTADAFATAFMVMGLEKSISLSNKLKDIDVYFIYSDSTQEFNIYSSNRIKDYLE